MTEPKKPAKKRLPLKGKRGRIKKKPPVKKKPLSPEVKLQKRVTALRNLSKNNPSLKAKLDAQKSLAELTLAEQVAKQQLATKTAEEQVTGAERLDALFKEMGYDPAQALIDMIKRTDLKPSEEINIHKTLLNKKYGDIKSVDIQGKIDSTVTVRIQSFADATVDHMKKAHEIIDVNDEDYAEFEVEDSEDA
jgi:hypothetical protein